MPKIDRYELKPEGEHFTLVIYIDPGLEEFASELGKEPKQKEQLHTQVQSLIKGNFRSIKITTVKIMVGSLLLTTFAIDSLPAGAQTTASNTHHAYLDEVSTYTVKSGDSLSLIARNFNIQVTH